MPTGKKPAVPSALDLMVRDARKLQDQRSTLEAKKHALDERYNALRGEIAAAMAELKLESVSTKYGSASVAKRGLATIDDFKVLVKWAADNDASDILRKQANIQAIRARWEDGFKVPGVHEEFELVLTIRKPGKKG